MIHTVLSNVHLFGNDLLCARGREKLFNALGAEKSPSHLLNVIRNDQI